MLPDGTSPQNRTQIFNLELPIAPSNASVVSVDMPKASDGVAWHVFAATLITTPTLNSTKTDTEPCLFVESVQATQRWDYVDGQQVQYVEVTIANTPAKLAGAASHQRAFTVEISSASGKSTAPVKVTRLAAGSFLRLDVPITGGDGSMESASVVIKDDKTGRMLVQSDDWQYTPGLTPFDSSDASLSRIQAPNWWRDAKMGIMIHWGVYSVPSE